MHSHRFYVAQVGSGSNTESLSSSTQSSSCTVNGEPAPCSQAAGVSAIIVLPMIILYVVLFVFWVKSLMHVIKHQDVPNRTLWLVLHFVGVGILAGIIYKFVVQKPYEKSHANGMAMGPNPAQGYPQQPGPMAQMSAPMASAPQPFQPPAPAQAPAPFSDPYAPQPSQTPPGPAVGPQPPVPPQPPVQGPPGQFR